MPSTRSGARYNPSSSSQKGNRHDYGRSQPGTEGKGSVDDFQTTDIGHSDADNTILPSQRANTSTRILGQHIQSQPQSIHKCTVLQGVADPRRSMEKLHEFLPDCEEIPGPSQNLQIAQWMASIDGEEKHDALDTRMEEKQPYTSQASAKNNPSGQHQQFQREKAATSSRQRAKERHHPTNLTARATGCHGKCVSDGQKNYGIKKERGGQIKISEMISDIFDFIPELYEAISDVKSHCSDKNTSICDNLKTHDLSLSQINETLKCFEKVLRTIKTSNDNNSFGNKINEQSDIIEKLTDKYSKFSIDDMIETRIDI
ncbi:hypothetical protein O181_093804 [Austropuccinia psidii MF-1]|uniref:Uncharacterized protein n=1 Tax=Austropuccinia psidii MF-1 TaxID=1389203 RepID=A0A9Q3PA65_9BASI|nr:hypothetical protein [Austropuccinia psidii MF-1]